MKELRFLFEIICFISVFLWSVGLYKPKKWETHNSLDVSLRN